MSNDTIHPKLKIKKKKLVKYLQQIYVFLHFKHCEFWSCPEYTQPVLWKATNWRTQGKLGQCPIIPLNRSRSEKLRKTCHLLRETWNRVVTSALICRLIPQTIEVH